MAQARKVKPSKKVSIRGKHNSLKMGCMIPWESTLERDYLKLAEFDSKVVHISAQPIRIKYLYQGKEKTYFPDFLIKTNDYWTYIIEIKPQDKMENEENKIKFQAGTIYCKEKGYIYRVLNEKDIRKGYLIENLDLLTDARAEYTDRTIMRKILNEIANRNSLFTIEELKESLEVEQGAFYLNLYYLIYSHQVNVDLINRPLNDSTTILL